MNLRPPGYEPGHLGIESHSGAHRQRSDDELEWKDNGKRGQAIPGIAAYETAVYYII